MARARQQSRPSCVRRGLDQTRWLRLRQGRGVAPCSAVKHPQLCGQPNPTTIWEHPRGGTLAIRILCIASLRHQRTGERVCVCVCVFVCVCPAALPYFSARVRARSAWSLVASCGGFSWLSSSVRDANEGFFRGSCKVLRQVCRVSQRTFLTRCHAAAAVLRACASRLVPALASTHKNAHQAWKNQCSSFCYLHIVASTKSLLVIKAISPC